MTLILVEAYEVLNIVNGKICTPCEDITHEISKLFSANTGLTKAIASVFKKNSNFIVISL